MDDELHDEPVDSSWVRGLERHIVRLAREKRELRRALRSIKASTGTPGFVMFNRIIAACDDALDRTDGRKRRPR